MERAKTILIVDDSSVSRNFHKNILKDSGFQVEEASNGMEALEKAMHRNYDIILCDINMPVMDGITFLKQYRQVNQQVPVLLISTRQEELDRKQGFLAGANLLLSKPIDPTKLVVHVKMLLTEEPNPANT